MFDFLELAKRRQSCRAFTGGPIKREDLESCLEAARMAPSACNSQPWSFAAVQSPEKVAKAARCGQVLGNLFLDKASAFIVIVEEHATLKPKVAERYDSQTFAAGDLGGAAMSICLAAESRGIGSCIVGIFDRIALAELCDIPEQKNIFLLIALGIPENSEIRPKVRKPAKDVVKYI